MKLQLSNVQETLLMPLWARAKYSKKNNPVLCDHKASEIIQSVEYDYFRLDQGMSEYSTVSMLVRARMIDDTIRRFVFAHPEATIVNLGAGLDTTFFRVDNGRIRWYDLDLPDVIDIRRKLFPETDRCRCIAKSLFDYSWTEDIQAEGNNVLIVSGGVLFYFEEAQVKDLFINMASRIPGVEIFFSTLSWFTKAMANRAIRKSGMQNAKIKWAITKTEKMNRWNENVRVIDSFPYYSKIDHKKFWSKKISNYMDFNDRHLSSSFVHLQLGN